MKFQERTITLNDGRTCTLRPTLPSDAADMIQYLKTTSAETPYLLRYPEEWTLTVEKEESMLQNLLDNEKGVMMVAIVDGKVAGNCSINGVGGARKVLHRASLAIALIKEFWGLGIGSAMISYLTELTRTMGYELIELEVIAGNKNAQALYRKCGFIESGRRTRAIKYDDGTYQDEILMTKIL